MKTIAIMFVCLSSCAFANTLPPTPEAQLPFGVECTVGNQH